MVLRTEGFVMAYLRIGIRKNRPRKWAIAGGILGLRRTCKNYFRPWTPSLIYICCTYHFGFVPGGCRNCNSLCSVSMGKSANALSKIHFSATMAPILKLFAQKISFLLGLMEPPLLEQRRTSFPVIGNETGPKIHSPSCCNKKSS